jgi:hypothetical protein
MAFREVVEIFIDTKVESAKSQLSGLKKSISDAEGGVGKFKAAASGIGDALGGLISSPAGLAAVGTAIVGVATKSVMAFQDLGIAVGKFSAATGTTTEEASRLVEVFDDIGVAPETAAASIARMSKTLDTNAESLAKYGIEAVKAADGTTDINETFIAAVDAISKIKNPTEQAAAAQATFGKSWQSMSEIVTGGAPALRKSLESVGDAKVMSKADVESARELRDAMDSIKDSGEGLALSLGRTLAPAIADIASEIGPAIDGLGELGKKLSELQEGASKGREERGFFDNVLRSVKGAVSPVDKAKQLWQDFGEVLGDPEVKGNADAFADGIHGVGVAADEVGPKLEASKEDVKAFADANKDLQKWVNDALKALQDQADQLEAQSEAYTTAADDQITYNDSLAKFAEVNEDAKASTDDVRDAAIASAKAHQALYVSMTETSGATATATGKIDAQNQSLLTQASTARGPARQAILDYVGTLNGIPPEKMTAIVAAVNAGDLAEAQRLLDEASAPRDAALIADANNAALAQTNKDLDNAAHDRTVNFNAQAVGLSALTGAFTGAIRAAGGTVTNVTNNVTVPRIPNARELARVNAQWARVNGRR